MLLPLIVDALDEKAARDIAAEVRELRKCLEETADSTYIPSYAEEYLDDTASIVRWLHWAQGNSSTVIRDLMRTSQWREQTKVYPAKQRACGSNASPKVDPQGLVLVRGRRATTRLSRPVGCQQTVAQGPCSWRYYSQSIQMLEDARVALKEAHECYGIIAQAAAVVPVESVCLADMSVDSLAHMVQVANTHYPGTIGRIYITASSSVLLEHARNSLQPVLQRVAQDFGYLYDDFVVFSLDDALVDGACELETWSLGLNDNKDRTKAEVLDGLVRRADSVYSDDAGTDVGDFHSALSDAHEAYGVLSENEAFHMPKSTASQLSCLSSHRVDGGDRSQRRQRSGSRIVQRMTPVNAQPHENRGRIADEAKSAVTPIQLASLQRAMQGVQSMLGSINDSIVSADSRSALAATKSKLVQQADVLMSTVAALSFGVSMMHGPSLGLSGSALAESAAAGESSVVAGRAIYFSAKDSGISNGRLGVLRNLALQLLALPVGLVFGRPRETLKLLKMLVAKSVNIALRRLRRLPGFQMLLLLAYRHLRIYAMIFWTAALLFWQANAAIIWSNLSAQWQRGIAF
ncbi:hypothetical protein H4R24_001768 [Coemansia sp. RSA 988]|nr:hypothetical protein H4R24_001768 [Coemansia sp. RSA 988]